MQSALVAAFASKHESTHEIAEAIAEQLWLHGLSVQTAAADRVADTEPYAAAAAARSTRTAGVRARPLPRRPRKGQPAATAGRRAV